MDIFGKSTQAGGTSASDDLFTLVGNELTLDPQYTLKTENLVATTQTTENTETLEISDPLVKYGNGNTNTSNNVGYYVQTGSNYTGFVNTGNNTHLIDHETVEPTTGTNTFNNHGNLTVQSLGLYGALIGQAAGPLEITAQQGQNIKLESGSNERVVINSEGIIVKPDSGGTSNLILENSLTKSFIIENFDDFLRFYRIDTTEPNMLFEIDLDGLQTLVNTTFQVKGDFYHVGGVPFEIYTNGNAINFHTNQGKMFDIGAVVDIYKNPFGYSSLRLTNDNNTLNIQNYNTELLIKANENWLKYDTTSKGTTIYTDSKEHVETFNDDIDVHHIYEFNTKIPKQLFELRPYISYRWKFQTKFNISSGIGSVLLDCAVMGDPTVNFRIRTIQDTLMAEKQVVFTNQTTLTDLSITIDNWINYTNLAEDQYWFEIYIDGLDFNTMKFILRGTQHLELDYIETMNTPKEYEKCFPNIRIESNNIGTSSDKRLRTKINGILELGEFKNVELALRHAVGSIDHHSKHLLSSEKQALTTGLGDLNTLTRHILTNTNQGSNVFSTLWLDESIPYTEIYNGGQNLRMTSSEGSYRYIRGDTTFSHLDQLEFEVKSLTSSNNCLIGITYGNVEQNIPVFNQPITGISANGFFFIDGVINTLPVPTQVGTNDVIKCVISGGNIVFFKNNVSILGAIGILPNRTDLRILVGDMSGLNHQTNPYDVDVTIVSSSGTLNGFVHIDNDVIIPHTLKLGSIANVESNILSAEGNITTITTKTQNITATPGETITSGNLTATGNITTQSLTVGSIANIETDLVNKQNQITTLSTKTQNISGTNTLTTVNNNLLTTGDFQCQNLTVSGTTTTVNTTEVSIEDNILRVAANNNADTIDSGFITEYKDGATSYARGLIYKPSLSRWEFLRNMDPNVGLNVSSNDYSSVRCLNLTCDNLNVNGVNISTKNTTQDNRLNTLESDTTNISYTSGTDQTEINSNVFKIVGTDGFLNCNNLTVKENILKLNNTITNDVRDVGFICRYVDTIPAYRGLVYNKQTNKWLLAKNMEEASVDNLLLNNLVYEDLKMGVLDTTDINLGTRNVDTDLTTLEQKTQYLTASGTALQNVLLNPQWSGVVTGLTLHQTTIGSDTKNYRLVCDNINGSYRWTQSDQSFTLPHSLSTLEFVIKTNRTSSNSHGVGISTNDLLRTSSLGVQPVGTYAYFYNSNGVCFTIANGSGTTVGTTTEWNTVNDELKVVIPQNTTAIQFYVNNVLKRTVNAQTGLTYYITGGDVSNAHVGSGNDIDVEFVSFSGILSQTQGNNPVSVIDSDLVINTDVYKSTQFGDIKQDTSLSAYGYRNYVYSTLTAFSPAASTNFTTLQYGTGATHNNTYSYNVNIPYAINSDISVNITQDGDYKIIASIGGDYDHKGSECEYAIMKNGTPIYVGGRKSEEKNFEDVSLIAINNFQANDVITFGYRNITGSEQFSMYECTIVVEKLRKNDGYF